MSTVPAAREVVELYNLELWNNRDFELAEELIADTVIRHEVGEAHTLTREQALNASPRTWESSTTSASTSTSWSPMTTASMSPSSTTRS